MATITDAEYSVSTTGDIRATTPSGNHTVLELHRWLQDLADDAAAAGNDYMDISFPTPSVRSTDQIISLNYPYNIDDATAETLYGGSIQQEDVNGNTTLYSGLRVLGSVNSVATQIQIIQDNALYDGDAPFWGDQDPTGYNGGGSVLMRVLVKSRDNGYDIDGKKIRVRAAHMHATGGDTFASFDVELGLAESVAAISTVDDPQNTTAVATIGGWTTTDEPDNIEGYQTIDINDGNGAQPYYSQWTYDGNTGAMKALWEYAKYVTRVGSAETPYGLDGDLFQGITHEIDYDGQTVNMQEDEYAVWGTHIWYDGLAGGEFTRGYYVLFSGGNAGKVLYHDATNDELLIAVQDTSITIADDETITEYVPSTGAASGVTAAVDTGAGGGSAIEDNDKDGGEGWILAMLDSGATGTIWIQLTYGDVPADNLVIHGVTTTLSLGTTASPRSGVTQGTPDPKTIPSVFLGAYTGSLIGAYGVGIDPDDLVSGDTVQDLDGDTLNAPNNVQYDVEGLVVGEDYILVMKKHASNNDFDFEEMTLATTLNTTGRTQIDVGSGNIPLDAPASGVVRVTLDDGRHRRVPYNSISGTQQYFEITSSDWSDPDDATAGVGVSLAFIDKLAGATTESFTVKYNAARTLWQRARDGGTAGDNEPIVTWEQQGSLTNTGGSAIVNRISDA